MRLAIFAALPQRMNFLPPMMAVATGPELTLMQDAICRPPNFRLGYDGLRIKGEVDISAGIVRTRSRYLGGSHVAVADGLDLPKIVFFDPTIDGYSQWGPAN
jgi:hypothetical protein